MGQTTTELLETIARRYNATDPIEPLDLKTQREVAGIQGATVGDTSGLTDSPTGASTDVDKVLNRARDRLTPAQLVRLGSFALVQRTPLRLPLPREARQIIVQNNTDLGGSPTNVVVNLSLHGVPAGPGDYVVRVGAERAWDVYATELSLYQGDTATVAVNNPGAAGGVVVLVAV